MLNDSTTERLNDSPWDVVVCGGGTAGAAAAIAAARQGARTVVIEQLGSLGGTQSNGWVTPMMPNYIGLEKLSKGLNLDIIAAQTKLQPAGNLDHGDDWYDPTLLALVLDRLATEAGVTCLFNATIIGASCSAQPSLQNPPDQDPTLNTQDSILRDKTQHTLESQHAAPSTQHNSEPVTRHPSPVTLQAIEIATRGGRRWIEGKTFIDCTGDAELSFYAGAELMGGNEEGVHQPMTLRFTMGNIDLEKARQSLKPFLRVDTDEYLEMGYGESKESPMAPLVAEAVAKQILQEDDLGYFQLFTVNGRPGELAFNTPRISGLDPLDPFDLSLAYQIGREKIFRIADFMRHSFDGFQNAYISVIAPLMGIRESRRVVGAYILTEEDHGSCRKFEDAIARNRYPVDIHLKKGIDYRKFPPGEWHDIPYRSLVVKGFTNLWVAGRCASATFVAQSAIRIQPVCRAMGEAAGIAASMCADQNIASSQLKPEQLRAKLNLS